ncbi:50S ribosomal protein L9 [Mycoplasma putrefaciens]|uniref:Large ribosomal subunit protein bL9 n=2 Tax=Mycoplasma putrefaciens TaxID=2123 RepID=M9WI87_9MOLU|nr:50S ribosomal protein L9 [Mycoplasma putrefaciens]AEM68454.1 ribosomal protein L9 [Mycoplasma putrefaciens KS1]AGJ91084.1 50S ribosomal protein L9 [Mycoplasma putrefaciens Mput9231]SYV94856.1 50S ribosomal protein L9 [Mycoplasma putrefaciens]
MKVIFLQDVKGQGKKDEIKEVSDGYAKNFLLPRKLVKIATDSSVNTLNTKLKAQQEEAQLLKAQNLALKKSLEEITLHFKLQTNDGKVFGSISNQDIVNQLKDLFKLEIDKKKFVNFKNINSIGLSYIKLKLDFGIEALIKVEVRES